jgi:hypothetical protein
LANTEDALADIIYNKEKLAHIMKLIHSFIVDMLAARLQEAEVQADYC